MSTAEMIWFIGRLTFSINLKAVISGYFMKQGMLLKKRAFNFLKEKNGSAIVSYFKLLKLLTRLSSQQRLKIHSEFLAQNPESRFFTKVLKAAVSDAEQINHNSDI